MGSHLGGSMPQFSLAMYVGLATGCERSAFAAYAEQIILSIFYMILYLALPYALSITASV